MENSEENVSGWSQREQTPQGYPQQPQPTRAPTQKPPGRGFLGTITSNGGLAAIITIGFVLLLVGVLIINAASFITNYGWNEPDSLEEAHDDEALQANMIDSGRIIQNIGVFFVVVILTLAGIYRDDWDIKYRISIIALALLFIMVIWFGFLTAIPTA
ncbi:MAG: hypothetical protein R6U17_00440 [Thermoplasmata archaeon]